jgi:cell division septum initiation protein DivIVA
MDPTGWLLDTSAPGDVARANFPIVRRGFDPIEVQAFARSVAAEITRLQQQNAELEKALASAEAKAHERLTEATVAGFLGEEAARMLEASRQTAESALRRAQESAARTVEEADEHAARTVASADTHAQDVDRAARLASDRRRHEADEYAARKRAEADEYAASTGAAARAEAEACQRQTELEARRLLDEAMNHRVSVLRELVYRRDLASAQIRSLMAGRDLVVEALGQVGALVAGVTSGLQEIGTAPTDFVQLDPEIEGVAQQPGAAVAVTRRGKQVSRSSNVELPAAAMASS